MANVTIYAEHRDILDALITSGKVASAAAATRTGPFKDQRDAYVFASSIALARRKPQPEAAMPTSKKGDVTAIRDSVFLGADGAEALAATVVLIEQDDELSVEAALGRQLELLSEDGLQEQLTILDRYAYAGFEWLKQNQKDESTIRDLVLTAIDEIACVEDVPAAQIVVQDPLLDVLLD
jgi:hypothetical protein